MLPAATCRPQVLCAVPAVEPDQAETALLIVPMLGDAAIVQQPVGQLYKRLSLVQQLVAQMGLC